MKTAVATLEPTTTMGIPAIAAKADATSLLQAITAAASNPQTDIEKMERLFAMHQKMVAQQAEAAFNAAMAIAQANIQPVSRDAENTQTNSYYATLAAICKMLVPVYSAEGLSVSFNAADSPGPGVCRTLAIVSHAAGFSREYHYDLPLDDVGSKGNVNKTKVHATKSTTSYAKNILLCMIFNVATKDEDDDGNAASGKSEVTPDPEGKKALEACGSMNALRVAWGALTAEQRHTLGEIKNQMKKLIQEADATAEAQK